ncbi:MAG TPA: hypothetical protein PKX23_07760 [Verrucomicrobiota bacterium]|nr:hypothetical protein [Verrucomicrobiota bacterium]
MSDRGTAGPKVLGLFEKRIEGDDCLLELARRRFQAAGLGVEVHAGMADPLEHLLRFRPAPDAPVVVHLPREFSLTHPGCRQQIVELARRFSRRVEGFVIHDHPDLANQPELFRGAAEVVNADLAAVSDGPMLFIEYAAGLQPEVFAEFFHSIRGLPRVSACLDIGHVGIWQARKAFAQRHPGQDVCALKSRPEELPRYLSDIEQAVGTALEAVLDLLTAIGSLGKPLHCHLHDGHPLSEFSPFGVSDHLSFFTSIPLPGAPGGRRSVPPMFGPAGLKRILERALQCAGPEQLSLTLEIHPTFERKPLADAAPLFAHWTDKTNAEKMNHWVDTLTQNAGLAAEVCAEVLASLSRTGSPSSARAGNSRPPAT